VSGNAIRSDGVPATVQGAKQISQGQRCGFGKFWQVDSRKSGLVGFGWQGIFQVEAACSSRGPIELEEAPALEDAIEDGRRQVLVV